VELVAADVDGQELSDNAVKGDTLLVKGRPATVAGHSKRGGLLVTPGAGKVEQSTKNRPRYAPDHGPDDDGSDID
jgi:hypothetical protein